MEKPNPSVIRSESVPPPLSRMLLSIDGQPCPFGCTYCFANFSQYVAPRTLGEIEAQPTLAESVDVLYPACDVDLLARPDLDDVLRRVARFGKSVSISTKASVGTRALRSLQWLQGELAVQGSVLKVSVSVSTKFRFLEVEPRTPGYESRVRSLRALKDAGIPNSLVFRPLLADVSDREYEEILRDCEGLTSRLLVGDEWLDSGPKARSAAGIDARPLLSLRVVNWAAEEPTWTQRAIPGRVEHLKSYAGRFGFSLFESDLDLMRDVLD